MSHLIRIRRETKGLLDLSWEISCGTADLPLLTVIQRWPSTTNKSIIFVFRQTRDRVSRGPSGRTGTLCGGGVPGPADHLVLLWTALRQVSSVWSLTDLVIHITQNHITAFEPLTNWFTKFYRWAPGHKTLPWNFVETRHQALLRKREVMNSSGLNVLNASLFCSWKKKSFSKGGASCYQVYTHKECYKSKAAVQSFGFYNLCFGCLLGNYIRLFATGMMSLHLVISLLMQFIMAHNKGCKFRPFNHQQIAFSGLLV